jgi:hypothetical protein
VLPALYAVVGILGAATALNIVLLLAVLRRMREFEAGNQVPAAVKLPAPGTRVGSFRATATDGSVITEADLADDTHYLGFLLVGCKPCKAQIAEMRSSGRFDPERVIFFVAGGDPSAEQTRALMDSVQDLGRVAAMDWPGPVGAAMSGIRAFPTLLRIESGVIVAAGSRWEEIAESRVPALAG